MYIKNVTIQGFHNVENATYDFEKLCYLHGPNGVGKSTVLQAIQLGLLGYIPGTDKNKTAIMRHCSTGNLVICVTMQEGDDTVSIERSWIRKNGSIDATVNISPKGYDISNLIEEIELPIFNFNEFLGLTANKLKDWFIEFLPKDEWDADWEHELTTAVLERNLRCRDELIEYVLKEVDSLPGSGVDKVRSVNEFLKNLMSLKKSEKQNIESTIQSLTYNADYKDIDKDELAQDIEVLEGEIESQIKYNSIRDQRAVLESQLSEFKDLKDNIDDDDSYKASCKEQAALSAEYQNILSDWSRKEAEYRNLVDKQNSISDIISKGDVCPFTNDRCITISKSVEEQKQKYEEISKLVEAAEADWQASIQAKKTCVADVTRVAQNVESIQARYNKRDSIKSTLSSLPAPEGEYVDVDLLKATLKEKRDAMAGILANEKYDTLVDKFTKDKFDIDADIECIKCWQKLTSVNGLQNNDNSTKPFLDLMADINKFVPTFFGKSVEAKFNLSGKNNTFSFGIMRDGRYISYNMLSSGEKCMYMLSMMVSMINTANTPLKLIIIDDLLDHVDDKNMNKLFKAIESVDDIQFILAGVKKVKGDFVVELGK